MKSFRDSTLQQVVDRLGGAATLAGRLGVGLTALYNWDKRGLPARQKLRILDIAEEAGIELPQGFKKEPAHFNGIHNV